MIGGWLTLGRGRGAKQLQRPLGSHVAEQETELIRKKASTLKLLVWDEESELCTLSRCNKRLEKKRQWNGVGDVEGFKNRGSTYRGSSNLKLIITALVLFLETFSGVWGTKLQERAGEDAPKGYIYDRERWVDSLADVHVPRPANVQLRDGPSRTADLLIWKSQCGRCRAPPIAVPRALGSTASE